MKRSLSRFLGLVASAALACTAGAQAPPARLSLPPALAAAGAPVTVSGAPWAYLVWNVSSPEWLATRDIAVWIKPAAPDVSAAFTLQGVMSPLRDPAAIKPWIARALAIGGTTAEMNEACERLHRLWRNPAVPEPLPAALENRLSMLAGRAQSRPDGAAALRQLGNAQPVFRFLTATGWAGPLGVAAGQTATIELRERDRATGAEGAVVGRVSVVAGATSILPAPAAPVHVRPPFLTSLPVPAEQPLAIPVADRWPDLAAPLRWAVPEALRRQLLLARGFHVWRLQPGYTPPGGLTPAGLAAAAPDAQKKRLTRTPAAATKLFRPAGSTESGPAVNDFAADPSTWFLADDNGRYDFTAEPAPGQDPVLTGSAYTEGQTWDYVVGTVDLLGRISSVSPRLTSVPVCRTVPPSVPKALRVENIMKNGNQRLRVVWKPNANAASEVATTHYLVFRDRVRNTPSSTSTTDRTAMPARHAELIYLGVVPHSAGTNGELAFDDDALAPTAADFGQTYFYSVRAAHLGPCGYNCSAPGPPVFGTLRDRVGPAAPTGVIATECPRPAISRNLGRSALDVTTPPGFITIRVRVERADRGIAWATLDAAYFIDIGVPGPSQPTTLHFGNADAVWRDFIFPRNATRVPITLTAIAGTAAGRFSHVLASSETGLGDTAATMVTFTARTGSLIDLTPPDSSGPWAPYFLTNGAQGGAQTVSTFTPVAMAAASRGALPAAVAADSSVLIQFQSTTGSWVNAATAQVPAGSAQFHFTAGRNFSRPWRAWRIVDPPGQPAGLRCRHDARPPHKSTVTPIEITLLMAPTSREYRIYRRIDDGPLLLLAQAAGTWDAAAAQAVVAEDDLIPPAGGRIAYFGQTFDEHGNPSPLALLDELIGALPELPVPVVDVPVSEGTAAAPLLRLKATCPAPGVERIEILMSPPPEPSPGFVSIGNQDAQLFNFAAGSKVSGPQPYPNSLATELASSGSAAQTFTLDRTLAVRTGVAYTIQLRALGPDGYAGEWTAPREVTWQEPVAAGEVPWPARPLPTVADWHPGIEARTITLANYTLSVESPRTTIIIPSESKVHVRIGSFGLFGPPGTAEAWNVLGVDQAGTTIGNLLYSQVAGVGSVDPANPALMAPRKLLFPKLAWAGDIPTIDSSASLLPVVLYRQQTARLIEGAFQSLTETDLVQVSPMITGISWVPEPTGNRTFIRVTDPFVWASGRQMADSVNGSTFQIDLGITDTAPVASGARYRYWLAHFDSYGEVDQLIDAGELTIP